MVRLQCTLFLVAQYAGAPRWWTMPVATRLLSVREGEPPARRGLVSRPLDEPDRDQRGEAAEQRSRKRLGKREEF